MAFSGFWEVSINGFWLPKIENDSGIKNPTVVIVDDRIDLETQITATFNASDIPNLTSAGSKEELMKFLKVT